MDFDRVLQEIGEFGRYQKKNYLLICLPVMFSAAISLSYVFTAGTPAYRCYIPSCDDPSNPRLDEHWLVYATPGDSCYRYGINETYEQQLLLSKHNTNTNTDTNTNEAHEFHEKCPKELFDRNIEERCYEWLYDSKERTIVQEWQLTCKENNWKLAFVGTMHFAGVVTGAICIGFLADRFGRKIVFISCILIMSVTGILQAFSWSYNSFIMFKFLNAIGSSGVYPLAFIIGIEMVGPRMRELSGVLLNLFYATGQSLLALVAYLLHDWQKLQFALSVPTLFFITYYWLVPESVRWLIARNETEKAFQIIKKAAFVNKKELSMSILETFKFVADNKLLFVKEQHQQQQLEQQNEHEATEKCNGQNEMVNAFLEILKSKTLILRYSILIYIWIITVFVYYGLSLISTNFSGNKYLNFALVSLIEIPGYTLAWICLQKLGRRLTLFGSLLLGAVTCATGSYLTKSATSAVIMLFLIGKMGVTASYTVMYTYTVELMPTVIRSAGVSVSSTCAHLAASIAPFVPLLSVYYKSLPLLLFATASLTAGLMALYLPETFRKKLPDTVKEAKELGNNGNRSKNTTKFCTKNEETDKKNVDCFVLNVNVESNEIKSNI